MPTRKPLPARPTPTRRPPQRRSAPRLPWGLIIGGILVLLAVLIGGAILLRPRAGGSRPTPTILASSAAVATPDTIATAVAATVQAMATATTTSTPTTAPTPAPVATITLLPTATAPAASATPVPPTFNTAIQVNVQRDPEVDAATGIAVWTEPSDQSELRVLLRRADGTPLEKYISGYRQGADVSGNPVQEGRAVIGKWSGDSGIVTVAVPPDTYILDFNVDGWPWTTQFANHVVAAGQRTNILFDVSLLTVGLRYADGNPADKYVNVYLQAADVSGAPVEGDFINGEWTGENGLVTFELTPGLYALQVSGIDGYDSWGRFDHNVPGGGKYTVVLTLGRLSVETWNADGTVQTGVYVQIYTLTPDSRNVSVFDDPVRGHYSDNSGKAVFDLTPGLYGVQIGQELEFIDIPVEPGQTTTVNRDGYVTP